VETVQATEKTDCYALNAENFLAEFAGDEQVRTLASKAGEKAHNDDDDDDTRTSSAFVGRRAACRGNTAS
jgi:hypothetical protein